MHIDFQMDLYCNGETETGRRTPGMVLHVHIEKKDHFVEPAGDAFADTG